MRNITLSISNAIDVAARIRAAQNDTKGTPPFLTETCDAVTIPTPVFFAETVSLGSAAQTVRASLAFSAGWSPSRATLNFAPANRISPEM